MNQLINNETILMIFKYLRIMNCHHYCEDVIVLRNTNIPIFILLDVHRVVFLDTLVSCFVFLLRHFDLYIIHWSTVYLHPFWILWILR